MPDLDLAFENFPPEEGYKIDFKRLKGNHHKKADELRDEWEPEFDVVARAFGGNELDIAYIEGDQGQAINWHTHVPSVYQVYIPLAGWAEISYVDNEGETHTTEAGADELVYLPPGAHNRSRRSATTACACSSPTGNSSSLAPNSSSPTSPTTSTAPLAIQSTGWRSTRSGGSSSRRTTTSSSPTDRSLADPAAHAPSRP